MALTDPLLQALGFEGFVVHEDQQIKPTIAKGFQGFLSQEAPPFPTRPRGFGGFLIAYRTNEKYIKIETSRGRPFANCFVSVIQSTIIEGYTDSQGIISGVFDTSGILPITVTNGKIYYTYEVDGASQDLITTFLFPLDFAE